MIRLRRLFRVFGRGAIEFLKPSNRAALAYIRSHEKDDAVLCVANLARKVQPVHLDLSAFAGFVPVEILGYTEFPVIGAEPYFLTLGPYAFYWFELQPRQR
jgi:maltose alpha-D-glucosyltransferase/alpha-amylase